MGKQRVQADRLTRALTPSELLRMKITTLELSAPWEAVFGAPARTGVWIVWGESGSGKTSFALQLAKELARHGRVAYNSLEQGVSLTMQAAVARHELDILPRGRCLLISEPLERLSERLGRKRAPDFVIIDSLQYTGLRYRDYKTFKEQHRDKLIIFVSHAEGGKPKGATATSVMYDAEMKIAVEGYRAISKGRTFGKDPDAFFTIWGEGAARYWLKKEGAQ